ncbi:GNAT family N-acetyltransferase [Shewanella litorisediminis]|uniref:GNAT family N-acetyltransferase n=1 Tax=Shewanella litorisediminis TaxID=1173586 RepID=A0ABX7G312_9GAMM|nr:GNAT family N-acetyltransferase [Shewanella litorisediminis]MCL2917256.1 GNAT family N-acetyltransferase [Shewanella litorisediminis]QRH01727.1 GNAT family N-acetyltransferase [Shewanella litorisediminis]
MTDFRVSWVLTDMNMSVIHGFLQHSYWAKGIPEATLRRALENSLCFGLFCADEQIGFARMITDKATFAYLADVFVLESHRGRGGSKVLMQAVMAHPELAGLRRMMLATSDAHGLYRQFGFTDLGNPGIMMEIHRPNVYQL